MPASSSDDNSNWEDDTSSDEAPVKATTQVKPAAKAGAAKPKQAAGDFKIPEHLAHELDDPDEERLRLQKLALLRDRHLSGNMFGESSDDEDVASPAAVIQSRAQKILKTAKIGGDSKRLVSSNGVGGGLEAIQLDRYGDIEKFCDVLHRKISLSQAKSPAWLCLLDRVLQSCAGKMEVKDLQTLGRKVHAAATERKRELNFQMTTSKKGSDLKVDIRNPSAELDIAAGVGASDYSESEGFDDEFGM